MIREISEILNAEKISIASIMIFLGIFFSSELAAQHALDTSYHVWGPLEKNAIFPGGDEEMLCFIDKHLNKNIITSKLQEGKIFASFTIDTTGKVKSIRIVKSYSRKIDKEFKRVLKLMPNWIPGKIENRYIEQKFMWQLVLPYNAPYCR